MARGDSISTDIGGGHIGLVITTIALAVLPIAPALAGL
jgi:hypothetical protein